MAVRGTSIRRQMNGQLSLSDRKEIQALIGLGKKEFRLLYSAKRDGCSNDTFHKLCDYKGPTLTMLYNTNGTTFGGYTSMSWCSDDTYVSDGSAKLIQLRLNGVLKSRSFNCSAPANAIRRHASLGPIFGNDGLRSFSGTIANSGDSFALNGSFSGNAYDMQGVTAADFCNDTWTVTDLEVYNIMDDPRPDVASAGLLDTEWRRSAVVNWTSPMEALERLKFEIENYTPIQELLTNEARFPHVNILLMGPIGAGKSSLFNTVNSVFRDRIFYQARSGRAEHSLTTKYTKYRIISSETNKALSFRLCDTRGLEPEHLMTRDHIRFLLEGNLPNKCQIDTHATITSDYPGFVKYPGLDEKIHCVVFCIDASLADGQAELIPEVIQNIKEMQIVMNSLDVPQVVVLTKVDSVCGLTNENVGNVFRSPVVEQCVSKVAEDLGLPRNLVLPMKNYENEGELDDNINILTLLTIREILHNCDAHLFNHYDEIIKTFAAKRTDANKSN